MTIVNRLGRQWRLIAILVVGICVRAFYLGQCPQGLNQDETSLGYDAYSILNYGMDRHLTPYPAFLIAWGSGMNVLSAYLAVPFIKVFGLTALSLRLVNAISGMVSLAIFYTFVRTISGERQALWSTFVLAICPWHIMMSRWGLESNVLPAFFLTAVTCFIKAQERPRLWPLVGSLFGLCLYAYGTAYFAVPLFVTLGTLYMARRRTLNWRWFVAGVASFILVSAPIVATVLINRLRLPSTRMLGIGIPRMTTVPRYEQLSSLFGQDGLRRTWHNITALVTMILKQDDGASWNNIPEFGIVYPIGLGFAALGLLTLVQNTLRYRLASQEVWVVLWLLVALLLGVVQEANINRVNLLWMPVVFLVAKGLNEASTDAWRARAFIAMMGAFFVAFCFSYFGPYRSASDGFFPGFGRALKVATATVNGEVCVTDRVNMPYVFALFYDRTDPRKFARTVVYEGEGEFQGVKSFDRFTFGISRCPPGTQAYVLERGEDEPLEATGTEIFRSSRYVVVKK
ncbi:MAG: glycosyltransferase family 39 protein [Deltaproteobacteria bacterium]|nr:glycosyltransferase family 39 protein [Deltaproteobacteria bacterium]